MSESTQVLDNARPDLASAEYWARYHIDAAVEGFASVAESLDHFNWRCRVYPGYLETMPVDCADGKVIVDFGCGPGNDLIGFGCFSKPTRIIGIDVSTLALSMAARRAQLHGLSVELHYAPPGTVEIKVPTASVDLIHSSGVLHHLPDPVAVLREMRRVVKPTGHAQIMVYHRDSIWLHLYVAYIKQLKEGLYVGHSKIDAFQRTTDGEECPISRCWTFGDMTAMAREAGFHCEDAGVSMSTTEMKSLQERWAALEDKRLDPESRAFLYELVLNERGWPVYRGRVAGINLAVRLLPL